MKNKSYSSEMEGRGKEGKGREKKPGPMHSTCAKHMATVLFSDMNEIFLLFVVVLLLLFCCCGCGCD